MNQFLCCFRSLIQRLKCRLSILKASHLFDKLQDFSQFFVAVVTQKFEQFFVAHREFFLRVWNWYEITSSLNLSPPASPTFARFDNHAFDRIIR